MDPSTKTVSRTAEDPTQQIEKSLSLQVAIPVDAPSRIADLTELEAKDALHLAVEKIKTTEKQLNEAVEQLASLHSTDKFREGDDIIARKREELRHDIRQWSKNFRYSTRKGISWITERIRLAFSGEETPPFQTVTPYYQWYLGDDAENGLSLIVQGFVWKRLLEEVFNCYVCREKGILSRV